MNSEIDVKHWLNPMPDYEPSSDDDESLEPWFNDTGDFFDNLEEDENDCK
jgi:hypothetical protein